MLLPPIPTPELDRDRSQLAHHPLITEALGSPVHLLHEGCSRSYAGKRVVMHAWLGPLPPVATMDSELGIEVATPLFTLLTMAPSVSEYLLIMAMYELCGSFAVFQPSSMIESLLQHAYADRMLDASFGWRRMVSAAGRKTNLWERPPLIEIDELHEYAESIAGLRGAKQFARAASAVSGITASPLEVQASMLLGMGRRRGGWGFRIANNIELTMTRDARLISGTRRRIADIVITSEDGERCLIVECQGEAFHGSAEARVMDSDRTTALQSMGYQVIQVTYRQFRNEDTCAVLIGLIERPLGMGHHEKTRLQREREARLRSEIFLPWESFWALQEQKEGQEIRNFRKTPSDIPSGE